MGVERWVLPGVFLLTPNCNCSIVPGMDERSREYQKDKQILSLIAHAYGNGNREGISVF
jgi:hypothetical protein